MARKENCLGVKRKMFQTNVAWKKYFEHGVKNEKKYFEQGVKRKIF